MCRCCRSMILGDFSRPGPRVTLLADLSMCSQGSAAARLQRAPPTARNSPPCCSRCKRLLVNGVHYRKVSQGGGGSMELQSNTGSDRKCVLQDGESRDVPGLVFCSPTCSALFESEQQNRSARLKVTQPVRFLLTSLFTLCASHHALVCLCPQPAVPVLLDGSSSTPLSRTQHQYANNMSSIAVHSLPRTDSSCCSPSSSSPPLAFPPASAITMETRLHPDSLKVRLIPSLTSLNLQVPCHQVAHGYFSLFDRSKSS